MRLVIVAMCQLISVVCFSQNSLDLLNFYTAKDGLTNNTIHCVTKDSRGFLWIGTKEGLNKFDGLQFKKFFSGKDVTHSLSNNNIFCISEYRYGQLLIGTADGISVLNTITGEFENEKIQVPFLKAGSGTIVTSFFKDNESRTWINANGEIDIIDSNLHYLQRFSDLPWAKNIKGVLVRFQNWQMDREGRLWLPSDTTGINVIDFAAKEVWNYKNNPHHFPFLNYRYVRSLFIEKNGVKIWYAPWGEGLMSYDFSSKKQQQQLFGIKNQGEKRSINCILQKKSGEVLCASGESLFQVDAQSLTYSELEKNLYGIHSFYDRDNSLYWIGAATGLYQFSEQSIVTNLNITTSKEQPIYCNAIIYSKNNKLYALYTGRLVEVEGDRKQTHSYLLPKNILTNGLCEDKNGIIWIATSKGILQFDPETKKISAYNFSPSKAKDLFFNTIFCDSHNDIWLTTRDALRIYRLSIQKKLAQKMDDPAIDLFNADNKSKNIISGIAEDEKQNIWLSSEISGGILCFDRAQNRWKLFQGKDARTKMILKRGCVSLLPANCYLWLNHFYSGGLLRYNPATDEINFFTRNEGLLSDYILNVNYDGKNYLWLLTEKGISQFNILTHQIKNKSLSNIQLSTGKMAASLYDNVSHSVVYGGVNNLSFIHVNEIPFNLAPPNPVINAIAIYNSPQFIDPAKKFFLKYNQNNISIDFTAIQFNDADKIHFAYQLQGVEKNWQYGDINRVAQYSNLAPGHYTFKIKTRNESGTWSNEYNALSFVIHPPFWQTWWFIILITLALAAGIYSLMMLRIRQVKKESQFRQKIAETEMMALRAQMNPHFIFNCLSAIDNMIQTNQKDKATTYLTRFAQLIRLVLDSSKNNLVPFYKDYESLKLFLQLEQFRGNNKFEYELNADPEILNSDFKVPPLVIQPFVENAIHHGLMNKPGAERKLSIQIGLEKEYIKYTIEDNGIGRQRSSEINKLSRPEHISYGIEIAKKRISLHNHNGLQPSVIITDLEEKNSSGTKVELWLSVK